jgi:uncharacterized membrane protein
MKQNLVLALLPLGMTVTVAAAPNFAKDIQPILQEKCIDCHAAPYKKGSRLKKPKGDYRMDTRENITKAGESEEPGVLPGNAAKSESYKRIILPEDHDDIMPPKGDPLTPAQQKLIKDWIDAGAEWPKGVVLKREG